MFPEHSPIEALCSQSNDSHLVNARHSDVSGSGRPRLFRECWINQLHDANYFTGGFGVNTAQPDPEAVIIKVVSKLRRSSNMSESDAVVLLAAPMLWHKWYR